MRPDLAKCTTECYRRGAGSIEQIYKLKFGGKIPVHPDPEHEYDDERGGFHSSARHRHKESKDFGDKLGALKGNIHKNVGRPWDDVFSEFCKNLDRRSLNGYHIWTHLKMEVEFNTYLGVDGKVYSWGRYGWQGEVTGYYVHPITGILSFNPYRRRKKEPQNVTKLKLADGSWFEKIEGLWFGFSQNGVRTEFDFYLGNYVTKPIIVKRSANRKEISWIKEQIAKL